MDPTLIGGRGNFGLPNRLSRRTVLPPDPEQEPYHMTTLHRLIVALVAAALALLATPSTATAASSPEVQSSAEATSTSVNCSSIRELGNSTVVRDKGMSAFTVRQYIGWCWDSSGSAWMNFSSVYVCAQYHALGFGYRSQVGIVVGGGGDTRGYTVGANRQRLTYSVPVRTVNQCTQGWGKLLRGGSETAQGLTSLVC
jgi:hypothetical protein